MARGRKSTRVKVLTHRDKKLLTQLSKTGISNRQQAKQYCSLNPDRIAKLEKSGYIKTSNHVVRGQNTQIIQLDKLGKEHLRQEESTFSFCQAQTNHLHHDLKLTEVYYNLDKEIQDTWRHERDLIKDIYDKLPEKEETLKTCVDATVVINGEVVAIEAVGESYTGNIMQMKEEISQMLGCSRMESV